MWEGITALLGIIATLCAWFFNPKRIVYAQLDTIYKKLEVLYVQRDKALSTNDNDTLTSVTSTIIELCETKKRLLERLG